MNAGVRDAVCRAMWSEMNIWMPEYGQTIAAVSRGLVEGTLTEPIFHAYPSDHSYPLNYSRAIAHQVGLHFHDDAAADEPDGWRRTVSAEGIGLAIESLRAIVAGQAAIHDGHWGFYPESLEEQGVTLEQVREVFRQVDGLRGAARLVRDAIDTYQAVRA